jgi:hypothetical protein
MNGNFSGYVLIVFGKEKIVFIVEAKNEIIENDVEKI